MDRVAVLSDVPVTGAIGSCSLLVDVLAARLERLASTDHGARLIHLDGPWGSGKTSLLHDLASRLSQTAGGHRPWLVTRFNAWSHQRTLPRWWSLLDVLHRDAARQLYAVAPGRAVLLFIWRLWWRLREGGGGYVLVPLAGVFAFVLWRRGFFGEGVVDAGEVLNALTVIAVFLAAGWGIVRTINRALLAASIGAESRLERTRSGTRIASKRFARLVRLIGRPVIVFIDDLDRCGPVFAVELLEGIEQMWGDVPVFYIAAADGAWLREAHLRTGSSAAAASADDASVIAARHRYDLTFADVVPVRAGPAWRGTDPESEQDRERATELFAGLTNLEAILAELESAVSRGEIARVALQRAALLRLEDPDIHRSIEHVLARFLPYLDPNPRGMRLFVSRFCTSLDDIILAGRPDHGSHETVQQIARWTILRLRWPLLADALAEHPDAIDRVRELALRTTTDSPERISDQRLAELLSDPGARRLVSGEGSTPSLDPRWLAGASFV